MFFGDPNTAPPSDDAPPPAPATATGAPDLSAHVQALIDAGIPDVPEFLKGSPDGLKDNWKSLKAVAKKLTEDNLALQMALKGKPAAPAAAEGQALPETEAVAQLQARIAELEPAARQWQETQARSQIGETLAFRDQFDKPRATILREATAALKKAGVEDPETAAGEFLRLGSEADMLEWLEEREISGVSERLLREKGAAFIDLTHDAEIEQQAPDPIARLRHWQEMEIAMGTKIAARMSDALKGQFLAAYPQARSLALDAENGDPTFFGTAGGMAHLESIASRLEAGEGFSPTEILEAMAHRPRADAYRALAERQAKELAELRQKVAAFNSADPGRSFVPGALPGATPAPDAAMPQFGGRSRMAPLIPADQIAAQLARR